MILFSIKEYPTLVLTFQTSAWTRAEYKEAIRGITEVIDFSIEKGERIRLLILGNEAVDQNPPPKVYLWIVADIMKAYSKFKVGLEKTAVFKPTSSMDKLLDMLFKVYKPARPLEMFKTEADARAWLMA